MPIFSIFVHFVGLNYKDMSYSTLHRTREISLNVVIQTYSTNEFHFIPFVKQCLPKNGANGASWHSFHTIYCEIIGFRIYTTVNARKRPGK